MKIIDRTTISENASATRSIQNFGSLLPYRMESVAAMRPDLTISMLTQALRNVYTNKKSVGEFTPINSLAVEWKIDVNYIAKIKITKAPSGAPTLFKSEKIYLEKKYFDKNDTFAAENRQQYFVISEPKRLAPNVWQHEVLLVGNDPTKTGDVSYLAAGRTVRYRSNYFPELSERGYTKFLSNTETHRNYLSRNRASVDWSGDYAIAEEVIIQDGAKYNNQLYKMNKKEKDCLDSFLLSRENNLIFSETNFDINGKCLMQDELGRDVPMGDGIITQIEKVCDKFFFNNLTIETIEDGMTALAEKCQNRIGNHWVFMTNLKFFTMFNRLMKSDLRWRAIDDARFWSKGEGEFIKVGNTYDSYEFAGNTITFTVNSALSTEYTDKAYAVLLDVSKDETSGKPNLAMFTLEGSEMISGNLNGLGGQTGNTDGEISSSVHGSSYHLLGYSGGVLFNPYKSVLFEQAIF